ncbi:hypothetical protein PCE1_003686 [Barthelona sp. PCE]
MNEGRTSSLNSMIETLQACNFEETVEISRMFLNQHPRSNAGFLGARIHAKAVAAEAYLRMGKMTDSFKILKSATHEMNSIPPLDQNSSLRLAVSRLMGAYHMMNDEAEKAHECFSDVVERLPDLDETDEYLLEAGNIYLEFVQCLFVLGRIYKAIEVIKRLLQFSELDWHIQANAGFLLANCYLSIDLPHHCLDVLLTTEPLTDDFTDFAMEQTKIVLHAKLLLVRGLAYRSIGAMNQASECHQQSLTLLTHPHVRASPTDEWHMCTCLSNFYYGLDLVELNTDFISPIHLLVESYRMEKLPECYLGFSKLIRGVLELNDADTTQQVTNTFRKFDLPFEISQDGLLRLLQAGVGLCTKQGTSFLSDRMWVLFELSKLLANVYTRLGDLNAAHEVLNKLLLVSEDESHNPRRTAQVAHLFGCLLKEEGRHSSAYSMLNKSLMLFLRVIDTVSEQSNYSKQKELSATQLLENMSWSDDSDHEIIVAEIATVCCDIGLVFIEQGNAKRAHHYFNWCLKLRMKLFSSAEIQTGSINLSQTNYSISSVGTTAMDKSLPGLTDCSSPLVADVCMYLAISLMKTSPVQCRQYLNISKRILERCPMSREVNKQIEYLNTVMSRVIQIQHDIQNGERKISIGGKKTNGTLVAL